MSDEMDLEVLAESFAEMLAGEWPRDKAIAHERSGDVCSQSLWATMAELGWPALAVSEEQGGLGLGMAASAALHSALGAAVAPVPMLGTTLAVELLGTAGTPAQQAEWLPRLASGEVRAAVAQLGDAPLTASGSASGTAANVLDAPSASLLILRAVRDGQTGWLLVDARASGVAIERHALADTTRSLGTVTLANVPAGDDRFIAGTPAADLAMTRAACVALAADAVGGGEAVLAATIEYMKVREQFGVLIGSFQALKHRVADHQTALVASRGLVEHAAALAADDPQALLYALSAKQHVTRIVAEIARDCIQLHGGVGFTSEFVPHLYLKRGKLNETLWGTRATLLDRIADMLEAA